MRVLILLITFTLICSCGYTSESDIILNLKKGRIIKGVCVFEGPRSFTLSMGSANIIFKKESVSDIERIKNVESDQYIHYIWTYSELLNKDLAELNDIYCYVSENKHKFRRNYLTEVNSAFSYRLRIIGTRLDY